MITNLFPMKTLFSHPRFDYLVDDLVARRPDALKKWNLEYKKFPDGTPNFYIHDVKTDIEHQDVTYIGDFSSLDELVEQYALIRGMIDYYADKIRKENPMNAVHQSLFFYQPRQTRRNRLQEYLRLRL